MVTPPDGSRPAQLTQQQVDDLVRGNHHDVARLLRSPRSQPRAERAAKESGSRPLELSANDIEAIRRSGVASSRLVKRIAATAPAQETTQRKGKSKPRAVAGQPAGSPSVKPPGER